MTNRYDMTLEAERSLQRVLASANPYDAPIHGDVSYRAILSPVLDQLAEDQWEAVRHSDGQDVGIWHAVVGSDEAQTYWPDRPLERVTLLGDFQDYVCAADSGTSALWSPQAAWVILISEQWFGIAGGTREFVERLGEAWPPWPGGPATLAENLVAFVRSEREALTEPWLTHLLTHVYGSEVARGALDVVASEGEGGRD